MPYKITWEEKGMLIKWFGQATAAENIQSNGEIYGDERFDNIKYQIADFLDADLTKFSDKDASVIAILENQASIWNKNLKVAHITKDKEVIRLIKIYEAQMEKSGWQFMIFDNLKEAREWVDSFS